MKQKQLVRISYKFKKRGSDDTALLIIVHLRSMDVLK